MRLFDHISSQSTHWPKGLMVRNPSQTVIVGLNIKKGCKLNLFKDLKITLYSQIKPISLLIIIIIINKNN